MRTLRFRLALALVALALPAVVFAGTRIREILEERLKLSPAVRRALVVGDLNSILTGPASPTSIATKPYASDEAGLCRRDQIELLYVRSGERGDGPYKPVGVSGVAREYQYIGTFPTRSAAKLRRDCARLSGLDTNWISSSEGDQFVSFALSSLEQAINDVRARAEVTFDCRDVSVACETPDCYGFQMGDYTVILTVKYLGNGGRRTTIELASTEIVVA
jgi:hypothetical protein